MSQKLEDFAKAVGGDMRTIKELIEEIPLFRSKANLKLQLKTYVIEVKRDSVLNKAISYRIPEEIAGRPGYRYFRCYREDGSIYNIGPNTFTALSPGTNVTLFAASTANTQKIVRAIIVFFVLDFADDIEPDEVQDSN